MRSTVPNQIAGANGGERWSRAARIRMSLAALPAMASLYRWVTHRPHVRINPLASIRSAR